MKNDLYSPYFHPSCGRWRRTLRRSASSAARPSTSRRRWRWTWRTWRARWRPPTRPRRTASGSYASYRYILTHPQIGNVFAYIPYIGFKECTTFAPVTIAPMINANVKRNPSPNPNLNLNPDTLPRTKNPIITPTLTLCCRRYHRRSKCRITFSKVNDQASVSFLIWDFFVLLESHK